MRAISKLFYTYRLGKHIIKPERVFTGFISKYQNNLSISGYFYKMSQRSITSFFTKTPKKSIEKSDGDNNTTPEEKNQKTKSDKDSPTSPVENRKTEKRTSKRLRVESNSSESQSPQKVHESPKSDKKKKNKRLRIESTESESSIKTSQEKTEESVPIKSEPPTPSPVKKSSPKSKKTTETKKTPKRKTPAQKVKKEPAEKSPLREKNVKVESKKETAVKKVKDHEKDTKVENKKGNDVKKEKEDEKDAKAEKVAEENYDPSKPKYHPIKDACWSEGQDVPYLALAKTLEAIEAISARLKIIEILSNYFRSVIVLTPEDLLPSVYLCLNQLAPAYHSLELGIAETYLMKAIGQCTGRSLAQVKTLASRHGDLGLVAEQARATQTLMMKPKPLTLRNVFKGLKEIAHFTGQASVNKKISKIQSLYVACRHSEARYLIRCLAGKLRIGLAEQSVLQAVALAVTMTPPGQTDVLDASRELSAAEFKAKYDSNALIIKTTYSECPNYDQIIPVLLKEGVTALPDHCKLTPGVPLKPMLAHPTKGVHEVFDRFEGLKFTCEWKYDGERAQIHLPHERNVTEARIFSRNQEDNTTKYPDILRRLPTLLGDDVKSCVLDCEAVAYDVVNKQILPFQILSTRKRKEATEEEIKVQVCVFVFDLLYLNGEPLVRAPLQERRDKLREHFKEVPGEWQFATSKDCTTMEEVQQFLDESVKGSCEGLMVKTLDGKDATYEIAKRSHNWLKLKKDYLDGVGDTVDAVVIGCYQGRGKRTGAFGGFLLASYCPERETYQSLCKIGTGFTDNDLKTLTETLEKHVIDGPKNYYSVDPSLTPDVWVEAACVWEVRCADLSLSPSHRAAIGLVEPDKGISLRFPRFIRVREDKTPENATSSQQIAELYLSQDQVKNQTNKQAQDDFDFY